MKTKAMTKTNIPVYGVNYAKKCLPLPENGYVTYRASTPKNNSQFPTVTTVQVHRGHEEPFLEKRALNAPKRFRHTPPCLYITGHTQARDRTYAACVIKASTSRVIYWGIWEHFTITLSIQVSNKRSLAFCKVWIRIWHFNQS